MRLGLHPRQFEPVVEVRIERPRVVVRHDPEEVAALLRHETSQPRAQRGLHVIRHRQDFLVA